jgi:hypothetical protein
MTRRSRHDLKIAALKELKNELKNAEIMAGVRLRPKGSTASRAGPQVIRKFRY